MTPRLHHALLRMITAGAALVMVTLSLFLPAPASAQTAERCFPETGYCISGPIRQYWEQGGGLPVFGYPLGPQREELAEGRSIQVQWFERDRLEIQADGAITAGRLGARYLELTTRPWVVGAGGTAAPDCRLVPQTGYSVCGEILAYWERGGGVERFGYPLTGVIQEQIEGRTYQVQYFERRRVELHPELAGTPYAIQLGLLGRDIATAAVCPPAPTGLLQAGVRRYLDMMGCPSNQGRTGAVVWQQYEHGTMYWSAGSLIAPPMIFVIINDDTTQRSRWLARTDTYREGDVVGGAVPAGRVAPQRGFGKLWWSNADIRSALGWPLEGEQSGDGAAVPFNSGGWMLERPLPDMVVVMQPDGTAFGTKRDLLPR